MPSAKQNALFNASYQVLRLIFPIITYPYVSRILGPTGLGRVAYAHKVAEYFCLTALLGIPMYGLREISRVRDDQDQLSNVFSELFWLSTLLSLFALVVYSFLFVLVPHATAEASLHWLFALMIVVNPGRLDWLYQGLEQYRYITVRSFLTRVVTASLIFVVVRTVNHYVNYGALWVAGSVITGTWNFSYSARLVRLRIRGIRPFRHLRMIVPSAMIILISTLYSVLDVAMLGIMLDDDRYAVGLYTMAGRIMRIALSIVAAGTAVLLPRISRYYAAGDHHRAESLLMKSLSHTLFFSFPIAIGLMIVADDFVLVFAGRQFLEAITTTRILAPQLLIFAVGGIVNMQVFYARGKERSVLAITALTTVLAFVSNTFLIPVYQQNGAAFATLAVTALGLVLQSAFDLPLIWRVIATRDNRRMVILFVLWSALVIILKGWMAEAPHVWRLVGTVFAGATMFVAGSLVMRIAPAQELLNWISSKLNRKRASE